MQVNEELIKWIDDNFAPLQLSGRLDTFKSMLGVLHNRFPAPKILETGCQRQENDWGAGQSSLIFCKFLDKFARQGFLISVDINQANVNTCRRLTADFGSFRQVICSDSVSYINSLPTNTVLDLVYLDSWDYPIIEICDLYGPRSDFDKNYAMLAALPLEEFLRRHGDQVAPSQNHCLAETQSAVNFISDRSIIAFDDVSFPGGGKSRLAEEFLIQSGWQQIARNAQSVWVKSF